MPRSHLYNALNLAVWVGLGGCWHASERKHSAEAEVLAASRYLNDQTFQQIVRWVVAGDPRASSDWRYLEAYRLLRHQAEKDGTSIEQDVTAKLEEAILSARLNRPSEALLKAITRDRALMQRASEWDAWILPNLARYLPHPEQVDFGRVLFAAFLPKPSMRAGDTLVIDLTALTWPDAIGELTGEIVRDVYANELARQLPQTSRADLPTLTDRSLRALQIQGLSTYVAAQGFALDSVSSEFRASMDRKQVAARFDTLAASLRDAANSKHDYGDTFAVIGAYMAAVIEQRLGHKHLVATITKGPLDFWRAYEETSPGATVWLRWPTLEPEVLPEEAIGH